MASKCDSLPVHFSEGKYSDLSNWSFNMKMLNPLDESLRCRICCDYFNDCMITKCSHNYCSVCIRRYMTYKAQCPTCFQDASEPELRNNRLVDEILRLYIKVREGLQNLQLPSSLKTGQLPVTKSASSIEIKKEPSASSSSQQKKIEDIKDAANVDFKEVSCPVCYKTVSEDSINIHLDKCLKFQENQSERKSLPKLVYHLLSDKDIRKKLKEHGLNSTGDRQLLIRRHKNFITLYNANCDSLDPKPVGELVLEIERQELEEHVNSSPKPTQVHKKSDESDIEKEHQAYVKQHQSQFNDLIYDIQQRHLGQSIVRQDIKDSETEQCGSQPCKAIDESSTLKRHMSSDKGVALSSQIEETAYQSIHKEKAVACVKNLFPVESKKQETLSPCKIKEELPLSKNSEEGLISTMERKMTKKKYAEFLQYIASTPFSSTMTDDEKLISFEDMKREKARIKSKERAKRYRLKKSLEKLVSEMNNLDCSSNTNEALRKVNTNPPKTPEQRQQNINKCKRYRLNKKLNQIHAQSSEDTFSHTHCENTPRDSVPFISQNDIRKRKLTADRVKRFRLKRKAEQELALLLETASFSTNSNDSTE